MADDRSTIRATTPARSAREGFTLVELSIVLVVVGVVFAIATPRFSQAGSHRRVDLAMDRIERDIRLAEQDAWHTGNSRKVVFDVANNRYEIVGMTDAAGNPYIVDLSKAPYNLSLVSADFAGSATLTVDGRGTIPELGNVELAAGSVSVTANPALRETDSLAMTVSTTRSFASASTPELVEATASDDD